jgi:2,4-dienoyl-CoA reductase
MSSTGSCLEPAKYYPIIKTPMLPPNSLKGKVAFVTGGGTGLGKAMSTVLASLGASVAIASRRMEVLEQTAKEISSKTGQKVIPIQLNVKNAEEVKKAAEECEKKLGLPNIIINNAAGNFISPSERLSPNAVKAIVETVLLGTINVTLEFGKRLLAAKQGASFLAITTIYAREGSAFVTPSAAAKAGVDVFMRSLAAEWGKHGLRFNCIAPGPIYTEGAFGRLDPTGGQMTEEAPKKLTAGRLGELEELANLASYLVSDYSSWMNGTAIDFDGGEQRLRSGEFNFLHMIEKEQWESIEEAIRARTGKSKSKM